MVNIVFLTHPPQLVNCSNKVFKRAADNLMKKTPQNCGGWEGGEDKHAIKNVMYLKISGISRSLG